MHSAGSELFATKALDLLDDTAYSGPPRFEHIGPTMLRNTMLGVDVPRLRGPRISTLEMDVRTHLPRASHLVVS